MLKNFNLKEPFTVSFIIILLSFLALIGPLSLNNILFWIALSGINYGINKANLKFKTAINVLLIAFSIYLQFIFDFKTVTKEFFVHLLGVLMIFKFFELNKERDYYFYINLSFFISVISLLDGQDLLSSLNSFMIMIFGIYLLYIINQIEFPRFKFKNLLKIFGFILALFPFIIATYIIFPRTDININILGPSQSKIGIPKEISLGSFNSITNSREKVFDVNFISKEFNQKEFYFRVKVFDLLNKENVWLQTPRNYLQNFSIENKIISPKVEYELIMSAHEKKWVPVMDYVYEINNGYNVDPLNYTGLSNINLQKPKKFKMKSSKINYAKNLSDNGKEFYTKINSKNFPRLKEWVKNNNNGNSEEFINLILNKIKNEEYFYTLTPEKIGNNYDTFFFDTKEGYCEHYAGVFTILSRLANIPARIVTGYYGGELNDIGNFYTFRQSDAHSWVEVFFEDKGWVRYDPTNIIPLSRVSQNNNLFVDQQIYNQNEIDNNLIFSNKLKNRIGKFFQYFSYIDYKWTNFFLSYNQIKQKEIYNEIKNLNTNDYLTGNLRLFLNLILIILIFLIGNVFYKKINNLNFVVLEMIKILKKKNIVISSNSDVFFIFKEYQKYTNDKNANFYEYLYQNQKFKNLNVSFLDNLKVYLWIKKIALTN